MHCGKYSHKTDNCKADCDKPECGGLFRWPKHAPACPLNPANLKCPANTPHHQAQEADDDNDSEADMREAEESYLLSSDGVSSMHVEQFFDARDTPSKLTFFDACESLFLLEKGYRKRHRRKQIVAAEAAAQAQKDTPKPNLLNLFVKRCTNLVCVSSPSPTDRNKTTDHYFSTKYHKTNKATQQRQSKAHPLWPADLI